MEHVPYCRHWKMCSEKLLDSQYLIENSILSETQVLQLYFQPLDFPMNTFAIITSFLKDRKQKKQKERDKDEHTKI